MIQEIDAIDNGIDLGGAQRYRITTGLSERVSVLNIYQSAEGMCQSAQFKVAMQMCERDLCHKIHTKIFKQLASFEIVQKAFNDRLKIYPTGELIFLERGCSWKSNLSQIEDESDNQGLIKFVLYQDERKLFRIQAVPQSNSGFGDRVSLSKKLRGLRTGELN